jgi:hypothetical protein
MTFTLQLISIAVRNPGVLATQRGGDTCWRCFGRDQARYAGALGSSGPSTKPPNLFNWPERLGGRKNVLARERKGLEKGRGQREVVARER